MEQCLYSIMGEKEQDAYYVQNNHIQVNLYIFVTILRDVWKGLYQNVEVVTISGGIWGDFLQSLYFSD